jgi:hypothetical protein
LNNIIAISLILLWQFNYPGRRFYKFQIQYTIHTKDDTK